MELLVEEHKLKLKLNEAPKTQLDEIKAELYEKVAPYPPLVAPYPHLVALYTPLVALYTPLVAAAIRSSGGCSFVYMQQRLSPYACGKGAAVQACGTPLP